MTDQWRLGNCRRRPGKIISWAIFRRGYVNQELQVQFFEKSATHGSWRQFPNLVSGLNWIGLLPWNFLNFCFSIRHLTWFFFLSSGHCTLNLDSVKFHYSAVSCWLKLKYFKEWNNFSVTDQWAQGSEIAAGDRPKCSGARGFELGNFQFFEKVSYTQQLAATSEPCLVLTCWKGTVFKVKKIKNSSSEKFS